MYMPAIVGTEHIKTQHYYVNKKLDLYLIDARMTY